MHKGGSVQGTDAQIASLVGPQLGAEPDSQARAQKWKAVGGRVDKFAPGENVTMMVGRECLGCCTYKCHLFFSGARLGDDKGSSGLYCICQLKMQNYREASAAKTLKQREPLRGAGEGHAMTRATDQD